MVIPRSRRCSRKLVALFFCFSLYSMTMAQEPFLPSWESLCRYQIPEWYRDAKFGIFIHWGVYSVPAYGSEWYPREMYREGTDIFKHHVATYGPQDKFGYKDFIPLFTAARFDANQWADLFKRAGARYVVPVAEHHDGFAMYKTSLSRWNAFDMGPRKDIIGELAEAVRNHGMVFGLSSHRIEHWFFMNAGKKFNSDVQDPAYADLYGPAREEKDPLTAEHMNDWLLRCTELVDKYHPQVFWFDWWIEQPAMEPYRKTFAAYYYNHAKQWNKEVVINYKNTSFPDSAAVLDLERGKMEGIRGLPWQTDDAVGFKSWGYINGETYKSPQYLVDELVDIVSKNGNLLLNIGPRSDGTIPEEQQQLLLSIGRWLEINGEAIYGTRPWRIFGEGPTENIGGSFIDGKVKVFTQSDIRYTTKGEQLYAITLALPSQKIVMPALATGRLKTPVQKLNLLGSDEKLAWKQTKNGLEINLPKHFPSAYGAAFRIDFAK